MKLLKEEIAILKKKHKKEAYKRIRSLMFGVAEPTFEERQAFFNKITEKKNKTSNPINLKQKGEFYKKEKTNFIMPS